jgi:hypothetical protein
MERERNSDAFGLLQPIIGFGIAARRRRSDRRPGTQVHERSHADNELVFGEQAKSNFNCNLLSTLIRCASEPRRTISGVRSMLGFKLVLRKRGRHVIQPSMASEVDPGNRTKR